MPAPPGWSAEVRKQACDRKDAVTRKALRQGDAGEPESSPASSYLLSPITPPENEMANTNTQRRPNQAQLLLQRIGVAAESNPKQAHGGKNASATKSGPGRYCVSGNPGNRLTKERPQRAYVALMAAWASKRIPNWKGERDQEGAYTLTGMSLDRETGEVIRRKWLAGISAQRGY